jgi:hypothetical protein
MPVLESPLATDTVGTNPSQIHSNDVEKQVTTVVLEKLDIEHAIVQDDPRDWSRRRKVCTAS